MADKFEEKARLRTLASEYEAKLSQREDKLRKSLTPEQYDFLRNGERAAHPAIRTRLLEALLDPAVLPSEFLTRKMPWLFHAAIPSRDKEMVLYFADRLQEYPYSDSYTRRSFRAKANAAYTEKLVTLLGSYCAVYHPLVDAPLADVLNGNLPEDTKAYYETHSWQGCGYSCWQVAYALDCGDSRVEEAVRRILTEENGTARVTHDLIRGILISHRTDLHTLLGQLLLAARLQEGLRQAICESADYGTKEGFLAILNVIAENNLIRFSSVKRAVGTWLGLISEETRSLERISEKSLRLILDCLSDCALRREYLASEDAMKCYIALWSYGVDDVFTALEKVAEISDAGDLHRLLVAGYFAGNLDRPLLSHNIAKAVLERHGEQDAVLAVWLPSYMPFKVSVLHLASRKKVPVTYNDWFRDQEEVSKHYRLFQNLYTAFTAKTRTFSPCVFPWHEASVSKSDLAEVLCTLAVLSGEPKKLDEACLLLKDCNGSQRFIYFGALLREPKTALQRKTLIEGVADKSIETRKTAYDYVSKLTLSPEEYRSMEDYLRFKGADIRKNVMELLLKQKDEPLAACITRLLENPKEEVRLGGLDLLMQLNGDEKRCYLTAAFTDILRKRASADNLPAKEKILLETFLPAEQETDGEEDTLFVPSDRYVPTEFDQSYIADCLATFTEYFPASGLTGLLGEKKGTGIFEKLKSALTDGVACKTAITAASDLLSLSRFIDAHRTDSFENAWGETVLLGNVHYALHYRGKDNTFPLEELWQEWVTANAVTHQRIVAAAVLLHAYVEKKPYAVSSAPFIRDVFGTGFEYGKKLPYSGIMQGVLGRLLDCVPAEDLSRLGCAIALWFIRCVPEKMILLRDPKGRNYPIQMEVAHLLAHDQLQLFYSRVECHNDHLLKYVFPLAVAAEQRCVEAWRKLPKEEVPTELRYIAAYQEESAILVAPRDNINLSFSTVSAREYLFAAYQGIITRKQLYEYLLDPVVLKDSLEYVTEVAAYALEKERQISFRDPYHIRRKSRKLENLIGQKDASGENVEAYLQFVTEIYETVVPAVLSVELRRGDSPTPYSKGIRGIRRIYGAEQFARILSAMGNDTLDRTTYYGWGCATDRKSVLSHLLSVCIPAATDTPETFRKALDGRGIKTKRLIEGALFSPEWIPLAGSYLGIPSFASVCYYFMAHMNERFDDKRKAMIARFTPLSEEELNQGAFDVNWFRSAYQAIGEKEFNLIYDAAKYISDGAKHSRARKYADATLGKYTVEETEQTVSQKRNKDLLMAYALIPLQGEDDLCRRYLYLQRFRKESKQFGSQRVVSEGKAVEMALTNLAINAGYSDTMRLTLRMETKVIDDSRSLLEEQIVEGVSFKITTDENGKSALSVAKDGKPQKSIPAKLKKHPTVVSLTQLGKTLTEQYRRSRGMLETAMEDGTAFTFGELVALWAHPVVYPMLKNLVLIHGDLHGFLTERGLSDPAGNEHPLPEDAEVRIAHPFALHTLGCWRSYQKHLFDHQIKQPFRQVFRELYIKTEEEREQFHSLRYAGNQIQPAKTVGALKSRRWVADVENGLQKVYYKENVVARIFSLADWFSPADIEAPTLEYVSFYHRRTGEPIKIADVPDVIFSEVMRDVDLAVSVAHAGGVDPETSHSTMEMRAAILSFVLPMFRLENVKLEDRHAIVEGVRGEYSIHLGSGVVHLVGGAMIPVLPVHSQHKGKLFLPFADDDPKTAEIISKVLLFAQDGKIKDPSILSAISK